MEALKGLGARHQVVQACRKLVHHLPGLFHSFGGGGLQVTRQPCDLGLLAREPGGVGTHHGAQARLHGSRVGHSQGLHVELGARDAGGLHLGHLTGRQPGGHDLGGASGAGGHLPVHRAGAADGELQAVAVLQVDAALLAVHLAGEGGVELPVVHRQKDVGPSTTHLDGSLEEPCLHGHPAHVDSAIAQGKLHEDPLAALLGEGVGMQEHVLVKLKVDPAGPQGRRKVHAHGHVVGRAPVALDLRAVLRKDARMTRRGISAPGAARVHAGQPGRHLEAQTHGRGHGKAAALRGVVGPGIGFSVVARCLLGVLRRRAGGVGASVHVAVIVVGLLVHEVVGRGYLHRGQAAYDVLGHGRDAQRDLLGALCRAHELAVEDERHVLAHRPRGAVELAGQVVLAHGRCLHGVCQGLHHCSSSCDALSCRRARRWFSSSRRSSISVRACGHTVQRTILRYS